MTADHSVLFQFKLPAPAQYAHPPMQSCDSLDLPFTDPCSRVEIDSAKSHRVGFWKNVGAN